MSWPERQSPRCPPWTPGAACYRVTRLRDQILEPLAGLSFTQPDQRAVAQLADPLAGHPHHPADLFQRPALAILDPEIEPQHLGIARRQGGQRRLDVLSLAVGHGARIGAFLVRREALDPLVAVAIAG